MSEVESAAASLVDTTGRPAAARLLALVGRRQAGNGKPVRRPPCRHHQYRQLKVYYDDDLKAGRSSKAATQLDTIIDAAPSAQTLRLLLPPLPLQPRPILGGGGRSCCSPALAGSGSAQQPAGACAPGGSADLRLPRRCSAGRQTSATPPRLIFLMRFLVRACVSAGRYFVVGPLAPLAAGVANGGLLSIVRTSSASYLRGRTKVRE